MLTSTVETFNRVPCRGPPPPSLTPAQPNWKPRKQTEIDVCVVLGRYDGMVRIRIVPRRW